MADRGQEYRWYLVGCSGYGYEPVDEAEFAARWQELQDHAERLKAAEASGSLSDIEPEVRLAMQKRIKEDPFVKAVLMGIGEDQANG